MEDQRADDDQTPQGQTASWGDFARRIVTVVHLDRLGWKLVMISLVVLLVAKKLFCSRYELLSSSAHRLDVRTSKAIRDEP